MTAVKPRPAHLTVGLRFLMALVAGTAGGYLFFTLHLPLPWMLGAMLACGLCAIARLPVVLPVQARMPMTAVIGTMLGTTFTAETFGQILSWPIALAGVVLYVIVSGTVGYCYFRWVGRLDHPTAFFSGMPGGVIEMVTLGTERGGDERMISLIQGARIFLVVMCMPFVMAFLVDGPVARGTANWVPLSIVTPVSAAWFVASLALGVVIGHLFRLPARYLLGPMLVSAAVHAAGLTDFKLPSLVIAIAQIVIGASIGCRFAGVSPRLILRVFAVSIGATTLLLALSISFSLAVAHLSGISVASLALAYSPGGLPEMSLVALSLDIGVAFVVVHHLVRVLLVVAGAGAAFTLAGRFGKNDT